MMRSQTAARAAASTANDSASNLDLTGRWGKAPGARDENFTSPENRDVFEPYDRETDRLADWRTTNRCPFRKYHPAVWSSGSTFVSMMESPDFGERDDLSDFSLVCHPWIRRILVEREMGS